MSEKQIQPSPLVPGRKNDNFESSENSYFKLIFAFGLSILNGNCYNNLQLEILGFY